METETTVKPSKLIFMTNVPDNLLDKRLLRQHFAQYGTVRRVSIDTESACCSVCFMTNDQAYRAFTDGTNLGNYKLKIILGTGSAGPSLNDRTETQRDAHTYADLDMNYLDDENDVFATEPPLEETHSEKELLGLKKDILGELQKYTQRMPEESARNVQVTLENEARHKRIVTAGSKLLKKTSSASMTSEDLTKLERLKKKYEILEVRDKLYREKLRAAKLKVNIGTCPDMCPEKERIMRAYKRLWSSYELKPDGNRLAPELAVKEYSRSSADQEEPLPHELRPEPVLSMTMNYLVLNIMPTIEQPNVNLSKWYDFLWDRLRGIRKDAVQQQLCSVNAAHIFEQCARFHIVCFDRLCGEDASVFDEKINTENLNNCIQTLIHMYDDLNAQGIHCPHEPEFRAYDILLKLNRGDIIWEFQQLASHLQTAPGILFALHVFSAFNNNSYSKFFKLVTETSYLNACLLQRYFSIVRSKALKTITSTFRRPQNQSFKIPLKYLKMNLKFDNDNDVLDFCSSHGMLLTEDGDLSIGKFDFNIPSNVSSCLATSLRMIKQKRLDLPIAIAGPAGVPLERQHKVHSSFDANMKLKKLATNTMDQVKKLEEDFGYVVNNIPPIDIDENMLKEFEKVQHSVTSEDNKKSDQKVFHRLSGPGMDNAAAGGEGRKLSGWSSFEKEGTPFKPQLFPKPDGLFKTNPFPKDDNLFKTNLLANVDNKGAPSRSSLFNSSADSKLFTKPDPDEGLFKKPLLPKRFSGPSSDKAFAKPATDIFKQPSSSSVSNVFTKPSDDPMGILKPASGTFFAPKSESSGSLFAPKLETSGSHFAPKLETSGSLFAPKSESSGSLFAPKVETSGSLFAPKSESSGTLFAPKIESGVSLFAPKSEPLELKSSLIKPASGIIFPNANAAPSNNLFTNAATSTNLFAQSKEDNIFKKAISSISNNSNSLSTNVAQGSTVSQKESSTRVSGSIFGKPLGESANVSKPGGDVFTKPSFSNSLFEQPSSFSEFMKPGSTTTKIDTNSEASKPGGFKFLEKFSEIKNSQPELGNKTGFEKSFELFVQNSEQQNRKRPADESEEEKQREFEALQEEKEKQRQLELEQERQKELELANQREKELEVQRQQEMDKQRLRELEEQKQRELEMQRQREMEEERQRAVEEERLRLIELENQRQWEEKVKQEIIQKKVEFDFQIVMKRLAKAQEKKYKEHAELIKRLEKEKELRRLRKVVKKKIKYIHARKCARKWKERVRKLKINKLEFPHIVLASIENHTAVWGSVKDIKNHAPFQITERFEMLGLLKKSLPPSTEDIYLGTKISEILETNKVRPRFVKEYCESSTPLVWKVSFHMPRLADEYKTVGTALSRFLRKLCYDDKLALGDRERLQVNDTTLYSSYHLAHGDSMGNIAASDVYFFITSELWETLEQAYTRLTNAVEELHDDVEVVILLYRSRYNEDDLAKYCHLERSKIVHWHSASDVIQCVLSTFCSHFTAHPLHYESLGDFLLNELDQLFTRLQQGVDLPVCTDDLSNKLNSPNYVINLYNSFVSKLFEIVTPVNVASEFHSILFKSSHAIVLCPNHLNELVERLSLPRFKTWPVISVKKLRKLLKHFCSTIDTGGSNELYAQVMKALRLPKENLQNVLQNVNWGNILLPCFLWKLSHADVKTSFVFYDKEEVEAKVRSPWWFTITSSIANPSTGL